MVTFGDGRHCESHSNLEVVDGAAYPGASVDGVIEMSDVDDPHSHTDERDNLDNHRWFFNIRAESEYFRELLGPRAHLGKLLSELIQLLLQRSFLLLSRGHLVPNLTDLS